jgi:carboxylesterase type B
MVIRVIRLVNSLIIPRVMRREVLTWMYNVKLSRKLFRISRNPWYHINNFSKIFMTPFEDSTEEKTKKDDSKLAEIKRVKRKIINTNCLILISVTLTHDAFEP